MSRPSRQQYFMTLATKVGLRVNHHNVSDFINALRSHEYFGEAQLLERAVAKSTDLTMSTFINPFITSCNEIDLTPIHVVRERSQAVRDEVMAAAATGLVPLGEIMERHGFEDKDGGKTIYVDDPAPFSFQQLTQEHTVWIQHNFPEQLVDPLRAEDGFDGLVEEVGELARARLKKRQGIRGTAEEHDANIRDSIGDIVIFLNSWCIAHGIDLGECVETAWKEVRERDWKKYPKNGRPPVTPELHVGEKVDTSLGKGKLVYADIEMLDNGERGKGRCMISVDI